MRPIRIVIESPGANQFSGFIQRREPVVIKTFAAKRAVEAFDKCILIRLPWFDEVQLNSIFMRPLIQRRSCEFRTIVGSNHRRNFPLGFQSLQHLLHSLSTQRRVDFRRHAFPSEVIDDHQNTETPTLPDPVMHKVHRPNLIGRQRHRQRDASDGRSFLLPPEAQ